MTRTQLTDAPLFRAVLRALLFAAILEALFFRLLTIPAAPGNLRQAIDLHESTSAAGQLMFFLAFVLLLPALITVAYTTLRSPLWPGLSNGLIAIGILSLVTLGLSAFMTQRGPAFALGFEGLTLLVQLSMLAGMFERRRDAAGRGFAVLLAGSFLCMWFSNTSQLLDLLPVPDLAARVAPHAGSAGLWLLFAAGAVSFPAFAPLPLRRPGGIERAATLGLPAAGAFGLIIGSVLSPPLLSRLGPGLGAARLQPLPKIFVTSVAAAALFLVLLTAIRALREPVLRSRGAGLLFLLLAGYPHLVAYEHLLALLGVALVTGVPVLVPGERTAVAGVTRKPARILIPPPPGGGAGEEAREGG